MLVCRISVSISGNNAALLSRPVVSFFVAEMRFSYSRRGSEKPPLNNGNV
jgi:hypothetical protein